jgi:hypothetical protein
MLRSACLLHNGTAVVAPCWFSRCPVQHSSAFFMRRSPQEGGPKTFEPLPDDESGGTNGKEAGGGDGTFKVVLRAASPTTREAASAQNLSTSDSANDASVAFA